MVCEFGSTAKGEKASLYTLRNKGGIEIGVTDYGAALVKVLIPDKDGKVQDVVLGYDSAKAYEEGGVHFGATVGRVANRIGGACFELNGKIYALTANDNGNSLHGGCDYYNKRMWRAEEVTGQKVIFCLESPDGDQGYPGAVRISVTYELTDDNEIKLHYHAVSDADTLINLTNHSYFNLAGHKSGSALEQEITLFASQYTPAGETSIPLGCLVPVEGTPMDLRQPVPIGRHIGEPFQQLIWGRGYDHNFVVDGQSGSLRPAARAVSRVTGITMEVDTTCPGIQFYTANFIEEGRKGKDGAVYGFCHAYCLETQHFPDSPNQPEFPSCILRAGERYDQRTRFAFFLEK